MTSIFLDQRPCLVTLPEAPSLPPLIWIVGVLCSSRSLWMRNPLLDEFHCPLDASSSSACIILDSSWNENEYWIKLFHQTHFYEAQLFSKGMTISVLHYLIRMACLHQKGTGYLSTNMIQKKTSIDPCKRDHSVSVSYLPLNPYCLPQIIFEVPLLQGH